MHIEFRSQTVGDVEVFYRTAGRTEALRSTANLFPASS